MGISVYMIVKLGEYDQRVESANRDHVRGRRNMMWGFEGLRVWKHMCTDCFTLSYYVSCKYVYGINTIVRTDVD